MVLRTAGVAATVPMLRGVWGAALHDLDAAVYRRVFSPEEGSQRFSPPLYLLRPGPPMQDGLSVDFIIFGEAINDDAVLSKAWSLACKMGLGPMRGRFDVVRSAVLGPDGKLPAVGGPEEEQAWRLGAAFEAFAAAGLSRRSLPAQVSDAAENHRRWKTG